MEIHLTEKIITSSLHIRFLRESENFYKNKVLLSRKFIKYHIGDYVADEVDDNSCVS